MMGVKFPQQKMTVINYDIIKTETEPARGREKGGSTSLKIYSSLIFMSHLILSKIENCC